MKKALSIILAAITLLTVFASCKKEDVPTVMMSEDNMYEYVVLEDGSAKITKFLGNNVDIEYTIPSSIDGYTVTVIGEKAFENVTCLTVVYTPETIITVEPYAFAGSSVRKMFMHKNSSIIKEIGEYAFANCAQLIQVDMPRSLVTLGDYAYQNCPNLKVAFFRGNTENIGAYSFDACPKLTVYAYDDATNVLDYLETFPLIKSDIKAAPGSK